MKKTDRHTQVETEKETEIETYDERYKRKERKMLNEVNTTLLTYTTLMLYYAKQCMV